MRLNFALKLAVTAACIQPCRRLHQLPLAVQKLSQNDKSGPNSEWTFDFGSNKMPVSIDPKTYPLAPRDETIVDDYHGTKVPDPYRALEDPDAKVTSDFVAKLNEVSVPFLEQCQLRTKLGKTLTELWDYPKYGCTSKHGDYYFYSYNSGLQNQSVIYIQDSPESQGRVFLDPNKLSDDGTTSIRVKKFSKDGSIMAYGISERGSDWVTGKFMKVPSGDHLPDKLERIKFSDFAWTGDNGGIFYSKYPEATRHGDGTATEKLKFHSLYYHKMGTQQTEDILIAQFEEHPDWMVHSEVSEDGNYLIVSVDKGCDPHNLIFYLDLKALDNKIDADSKHKLHPLIDKFVARHEFIDSDNGSFLMLTNLDAPMFKLVRVDLSHPETENWKEIIPENEQCKLDWVAPVRENALIVNYIEHVKHVMHVYDRNGKHIEPIPLEIGSITGFFGRRKLSEIFFSFHSFNSAGKVYRVDLSNLEKLDIKVLREVTLKGMDLHKLKVDQVFYESKDGTKIPMYLVYNETTDIHAGNTPSILYGYGGFNIAVMPAFSISRVMFAAHLGGLVAVAALRGGCEYGEKWHEAGMLSRKQTVFDDFHSAADYLLSHKITKPSKLCVMGGSNGGLLVAACANQRPQSYGAVVNQVGVNDMLRYSLFTIGAAWIPEFGDPINSKEAFEYIYKYSPLHNIGTPNSEWQYPSILVTTADHDDRVVPLHSVKYMAEMYHKVTGSEGNHYQSNPIMARVEIKAGHGAGKPTTKVIAEYTDIYAFLVRVLDLHWID